MAVAGCSLVADLDGLIPEAGVDADSASDVRPDGGAESSTEASTDSDTPDTLETSIADAGTDVVDANNPDARFCDLHPAARYCNDFEGVTDSLVGFDEVVPNPFSVQIAEKSLARAAGGVASFRIVTTNLTGSGFNDTYVRKRVALGSIPARLEISYSVWIDQVIDGNGIDQFTLQDLGVNRPHGATRPIISTSLTQIAAFADGGSQQTTGAWTRNPTPTGKWFPVKYTYKRNPDTLEWTIDSTSAITGVLSVLGNPLRFNTLVLDIGYFTYNNKKPQREIFVDNILVETF